MRVTYSPENPLARFDLDGVELGADESTDVSEGRAREIDARYPGQFRLHPDASSSGSGASSDPARKVSAQPSSGTATSRQSTTETGDSE